MRPGMKMLAARSAGSNGNNNRGDNARGYQQQIGEPVYYPRPYNEGNNRMEDRYGARNDGNMEMYGYGNQGANGAYNRSGMNGPDSWEYTRTDTANGEMEARRRYRRYDNGRFAPKNEMEGNGGESHYPFVPPPPAYEGGSDMNRIGFSAGGEFRQDYPNNASYPRGEQRPSEMMLGKAEDRKAMRLDPKMAEEWMKMLVNEDGTKGPHWTFEQVRTMMQQHNLSFDTHEFWAVLNAIYSDDVAVAKKYGVNKPEYYIDRAKAWLSDKDAVDGKAAAYFCYVVEQDH